MRSYLSDDIFEVSFSPCIRGVCHHGDYGVVKLLVLVVEEHQLGPEVSLLCGTKDLAGRKDRGTKVTGSARMT